MRALLLTAAALAVAAGTAAGSTHPIAGIYRTTISGKTPAALNGNWQITIFHVGD